MLGNWSLGDYFKKESINFSFEFLTKNLKIAEDKLKVTCFEGDKNSQKDEEAAEIWRKLGIAESSITFLPKGENWWGPAGLTGPCGPDTEIFYKGVEIWNNVFMQYIKDEKGKYHLAKQKNVDTGMGVERVTTLLNNLKDDYLSDSFKTIIEQIEKNSKKKYYGNERAMRIIADHIKASIFILADGIKPSNTEQGYVLRRIIRRAIKFGKQIEMKNFTKEIAEPVFAIYSDYSHLQKNKKDVDKLTKGDEAGILFEGNVKIEKGDIIVAYIEERHKGEL